MNPGPSTKGSPYPGRIRLIRSIDANPGVEAPEKLRGRSPSGAGYLTVAVVDEKVVGFAKAGLARRKGRVPPPGGSDEVWALYALSERHGTGIGAPLLDVVLPLARPAELWMADGNLRARRFYEKHGSQRTVPGSPMTSTSFSSA